MITEQKNNEGRLTITFNTDQIYTHIAKKAEKELFPLPENIHTVILDIDNVEYITSPFIHICLRLYQNISFYNLKIINPDTFVKNIFKTLGLKEKFNIK
jgi:hypothetical protein